MGMRILDLHGNGKVAINIDKSGNEVEADGSGDVVNFRFWLSAAD